jgi:hypothetical protein
MSKEKRAKSWYALNVKRRFLTQLMEKRLALPTRLV